MELLKTNRIINFSVKPEEDKEYIYFVQNLPIGKFIKEEDFDLLQTRSKLLVFPKTKMIDVRDLKIGDKVFLKGDYCTFRYYTLLESSSYTLSVQIHFLEFDEPLCVDLVRAEAVMFKVPMFKYTFNIKRGDKVLIDGNLKTIDCVFHNPDRQLKFTDGTKTPFLFPDNVAILTASHHLTEDDAVIL